MKPPRQAKTRDRPKQGRNRRDTPKTKKDKKKQKNLKNVLSSLHSQTATKGKGKK